MAPKQKIKGQKQIAEDNVSTLQFYRNMMLSSSAVYSVALWLFNSSFYMSDAVLLGFTIVIFVGCYQFMAYMARTKYGENGQLIDGGMDLNMEQGFGEHVKDLIILTVACQILSVFSNYFWLLWLVAPARAFWMLWKNILAPWIFQPAPEVSEKKMKKMERKMRR